METLVTSSQLLFFQDTDADALIAADAGGAVLYLPILNLLTPVSISAVWKKRAAALRWHVGEIHNLLHLLIHLVTPNLLPAPPPPTLFRCFYLEPG